MTPPRDVRRAGGAQPPRTRQQRRGRALQRAAFLAERAGTFDQRALDAAMAARLAADAAAPADPGARALPTSDTRRWVPIGPSVVRRGQAEGRPRVTGRIRDLQVSDDGRRAYAASAKGGVWYTDDAGGTWSPVGGWGDRRAGRGGNNNAKTCGCLLVHFGATAADDYVMVGTGEIVPTQLTAMWRSVSYQGGVGVLAARGAGAAGVGEAVWEDEAGIGQLEGLGVYRLARRPGRTPGASSGAAADQVVAATSGGLFLGTRAESGTSAVAAWSWSKLGALDTFVGGGTAPQVTDVLWLPGGDNGRIVVAVMGQGIAISDSAGAAVGANSGWAWAAGVNRPVAGVAIVGRLSLAPPVAGRVYVLGEVAGPPATATLWRIPDITAATPAAAVQVPGVPAALWTVNGNTQRDYDQAVAVFDHGGTDRVLLGGSAIQPVPPGGQWSASLWCFDVQTAPSLALVPAPNVSRTGAPPAGDGADQAGLVGNNLHADVHAVRVVRPAGSGTHVWVGCDGGVYLSTQGGRCNSFAPRAVGLAVLEVGYHAGHPTSSHYAAIGCQDNGTQVRTGDTVWEATLVGDGGGVAFHPTQPERLIAQYVQGVWLGRPAAGFQDPLNRATGGSYASGRESRASAFYSGPAAVRTSPTSARLAIGTERVWLTDDLGTAVAPAANTWGVLPAPGPAAAVTDPNPGGTDPAAQQAVGVPGLGPVVQLRWVTPTDLLAVYHFGLVRYTQAADGRWTARRLIPGTAGAPDPNVNLLTDVCPVPGTRNFYVTSVGDVPTGTAAPADTCWFFDAAANRFRATRLRRALDAPGTPPVPGPLDPAYSVVVDPAAPTNVYVGTVTGVWHSQRTSATTHTPWTPFMNGMPQATVQELGIWADPAGAAGAPRLLRAAVQSRGLWETDLAADEAQRTYVRVHARDDRRRFPTPLQNPLREATAPAESVVASPDVVVRPHANPANAPTWQLPAGAVINAANAPAYDLWTFQTAFRWHYPSVPADGQWSDHLADLVALHRSRQSPPLSPGDVIDRDLWNLVVRDTRIGAAGQPTTAAGDPRAVYRAPWQTAAAPDALATEVDLVEHVLPVRMFTDDVWQVYQEPSTVDVLIHHRDTRPVAPNGAFAALLWCTGTNRTTLLANATVAGLPAYAAALAAGTPATAPAGWTLAAPAAGGGVHRLGTALDARLPRAVSIDVDLSTALAWHYVLFLAVVGSTADTFATAPAGTPATISELVRAWPYAALRLVRIAPRPV